METSKPKMIYRKLGNTGLDVSVLSYGTWITAHDLKNERAIIDCMKRAYELGVNFFDTAEIYNAGNAEIIMGKGLKEIGAPREDIVVTTKLWKCEEGVNDKMLSRKHLCEAIKNSLKRLQLDYVDVVFCHRPDSHTPIKETVRAMDWIVEEGYAFYWATSMWNAAEIAEAMEICEKEDLNKPIADQVHYNALFRELHEKNLRHSYEKYKYGTTIWSPLAMGLLTGKYNSGDFPEGTRFHPDTDGSHFGYGYFGKDGKDKDAVIEKMNKFSKIAEEVGCTPAQLGLAWTLVNRDVSTCIFGATKVSQVEDNIGALEVASKWTEELEEKIEEVLGNEPEPEVDYNTFTPKRPRRRVALDCDMPSLKE
ncbi:unnamed protein product [Moneuplotes crassus]|uniref:NADP-dependent oxidoreductase domain-containing protein n=1 Tax=Euplotes crassus TaxID=5936 RepID=A0AAD1US88_EUPCR|nr:unnamed protein product [Moneuplotes crassus]